MHQRRHAGGVLDVNADVLYLEVVPDRLGVSAALLDRFEHRQFFSILDFRTVRSGMK